MDAIQKSKMHLTDDFPMDGFGRLKTMESPKTN